MALCVFQGPAIAQELSGPVDSPFVVVVSGSDYMWQEIDSVDRIEIVRKELLEFVSGFPGGRPLGLVAYTGDPTSCTEHNALVPPAVTSRSAVADALLRLSPSGRPAVTDAVAKTIDAYAASDVTTSIVLIAYKSDRCGGDLPATVTSLKSGGKRFVLHVITLASTGDADSLQAAAEASGGTYQDVANGPELLQALERVAAIPVDDSSPEPAPKDTDVGQDGTAGRAGDESFEPGWTAKTCNCVPGVDFESYGFYFPIVEPSVEADDETAPVASEPAKDEPVEDEPVGDEPNEVPDSQAVSFGSFSRIGYKPLYPRPDGSLLVPQLGNKVFVELPHKYQSKLDLVVEIDKWRRQNEEESERAVIFDIADVQRNLANDIAWLVQHYRFDGVTLRLHLDRSPDDEKQPITNAELAKWRLELLERIRFRLTNDKNINVVLDYSELNDAARTDEDPVEGCPSDAADTRAAVLNGRALLGELVPSADLVLVDRYDKNGKPVGLLCSEMEFLRVEMTGFVRNANPIVPVLGPGIELTEEESRRFENPASNFGGIGVNDIGSDGPFVQAIEEFYQVTIENLSEVAGAGQATWLKYIQLKVAPNLCDFVCPHRVEIRIAYFVALGLFGAAIVVSYFVFAARKYVQHIVFAGFGLVLLLTPSLYALCVPEFRDDAHLVFGLSVLLVAAYVVRRRWWRKEIEKVTV